MAINDTTSEEPPYETNGKVIPVTGNNPTTTDKLIIAWTPINETIPTDRKLW